MSFEIADSRQQADEAGVAVAAVGYCLAVAIVAAVHEQVSSTTQKICIRTLTQRRARKPTLRVFMHDAASKVHNSNSSIGHVHA